MRRNLVDVAFATAYANEAQALRARVKAVEKGLNDREAEQTTEDPLMGYVSIEAVRRWLKWVSDV